MSFKQKHDIVNILQGGVCLIENKESIGVLGNILYAQAMIKEME